MSVCPASKSGHCLQLSYGFTACDDGECDEVVIERMAERAREIAQAPARRTRRLERTP